jgi:hypothetical protein
MLITISPETRSPSSESPRRELIGSAVFIAIGAALIVLAPAKQSVEQVVAASA